MKIKYEVGERVQIIEGEFDGKFGQVTGEFTSTFGKQFLDVVLHGVQHEVEGVIVRDPVIRVRATDAKRP